MFLSSTSEINTGASFFKQVILKGNQLYQTFNLDPHKPNLEVVDVLRRIPQIKLTIIEDTGFFSIQDMINKLESLKEENGIVVAVLIIAPDKSMVISMDQNKIDIMDSHAHGQHGWLIASCLSRQCGTFCQLSFTDGKKILEC